jgi:hypothetical protein
MVIVKNGHKVRRNKSKIYHLLPNRTCNVPLHYPLSLRLPTLPSLDT